MAVKKKRVGANGERGHNYAVVLEDLRAQFKAFGEKLDGVDAKVDAVDAKVDAVDAKVDAVDAKVEALRGELGFVKLAVLELAKDRRAG